MNIVLDANILVSALLSPFGPPAQVLDLFLAGEIILAYDDRIYAEYGRVLRRPTFGFDLGQIELLLDYVVHQGLALSATPISVSLPDPDDLPFLEVASASGSMLVTGNIRHFPQELCHGIMVYTPQDFLIHWQQIHQA